MKNIVENNIPLIEVKKLSLSYTTYDKKFRKKEIYTLKEIDIQIYPGEMLAIIGASGAGKSLLAHTLLGLLPKNFKMTGQIYFKGEELTLDTLTALRGKEISLIPQTVSSLDPLMTAGKQVEHLLPKTIKKRKQEELFAKLQLPKSAKDLYPFELSGGMARKVLIALTLANNPSFIIADEPTPGLDESSLQETTIILKKLKDEGKGILFITHDLNMAVELADRIGIFYGGELVEIVRTINFSHHKKLRHPFTKALWQALPQNDFTPLLGNQPLFDEEINGCIFEPRCPQKTTICKQKKPEKRVYTNEMVRCFHA